MKFEEITFYPAAVEGKTFREFSEHEKHYGLSKEKLREIYDVLKKSNKPVDVKEAGEINDDVFKGEIK